MASPLAAHTSSYRAFSLDEALDGIAAAGYAAVEIAAVPGWAEHIVLDDSGHVRAALAQRGLELVAISAHADLTTREGLDHTLAAVRWAAELGIAHVNGALGDDDRARRHEDALLRNLDELADAAERAGIAVGLELEGELMGSGASAAALLRKLGRASIGITYDTANVEYFSGRTAVEDLPAALPHLAAVHLKDVAGHADATEFPPCGEGRVDFARVLQILRDHGYDGPLAIEVERDPGGDARPQRSAVDRGMRAAREHIAALGAG